MFFSSFSQQEKLFNEYMNSLASQLYNGKIKDVSLLDIPTFGTSLDPRDVVSVPYSSQPSATFANKRCNHTTLNSQLTHIANDWEYFMFRNDTIHPHDSLKTRQEPLCFDFSDVIQADFEAFLSIMKESSMTAFNNYNAEFGDESIHTFFDDFISKLDMKYLLQDSKQQIKSVEAVDDFMLKCSYGVGNLAVKEMFPGCTMLEPVLTSAGICHSFNSQPTQSLFKTSQYINTFKKVYKHEMDHNELVHPVGYGREAGLQMILNSRPIVDSPSHGQHKVFIDIMLIVFLSSSSILRTIKTTSLL
jgi:hypothetical protein